VVPQSTIQPKILGNCVPSTVSSSSSLEDSSLTGILDDVTLAKEIGAAAAGVPNPGGGANGLAVFEG
jgi:hypothetical protein